MRGRSWRLSGSMSASNTPRKRYSAINCSTETCLRSNPATAATGWVAPARARRAKDSTTGAWATSRPPFPWLGPAGKRCSLSKYSRHCPGHDCGPSKKATYRSPRTGGWAPTRYELERNTIIALMSDLRVCESRRAGSALVDRHELPPGGAGVELARPADLVFGVADHLLPLGDPAHGTRQREDAGEHRHRDAEGALHDPRI